MPAMFDRDVFFDSVRASLFDGKMTQQQVDGMNFKIDVWEDHPYSDDLRWLSYPFATSYHETSATMWPIEEYGKGSGQPYGQRDPETGQTYYGRGDVQLTWRDNYARATAELELTGDDDLEWHADRALYPPISADVMYRGMVEGWFRKNKLADFFSATKNDAFNARDIINGDKTRVPSWSGGVSIGNLIKSYHEKFLTALTLAAGAFEPEPQPEPEPEFEEVRVEIITTPGVKVSVIVNGDPVLPN